MLASQAGFEPAANGLEIRCSIQLSYWDVGHRVRPSLYAEAGSSVSGSFSGR
jgi:hypothetical protein